MLTLSEIIEKTGADIKMPALRWRLDRGWSLDDAIATPAMSRSEAGSLGAIKTNNDKAKSRTRS